MKMIDHASAVKVAMYWDFENVHASLYEQDIGNYKFSRFKPQPELIDVGAIMDYALSLGSVCINRAYCNWSFFFNYSDALSGHGLELVQLFPRGMNGKNGADIQLCVDLVEDVLRREVDVCIIVSGDSDFIGAAQKVRQYGKRVIGIGVRNFSNRFFQRVCDEFKFYDTLTEVEVAMPVMAAGSGKMDLDAGKRLLVATVSRLAAQHGDPAVLKTRVKPMMLRLEPSFDERDIITGDENTGFPNFTAFLAACHDVIDESGSGTGQTVRLKSGAVEAAAQGPLPDETRQKCRRLLVAAMTFMLRNRDVVLMAAIKQTMQKLEPQFDEKKLGAKNLLAFLRWFPDVVAIHGEGPTRTLELMVSKDECGYTAPLQSSKLSEALLGQEVIQAALRFHFDSLKATPAATWPDYYERLRTSLESQGTAVEKPALQAIQKLMWGAQTFKMLPDHGGITLADHFATFEDLQTHVTEHLTRTTSPSSDELPYAAAETPPLR